MIVLMDGVGLGIRLHVCDSVVLGLGLWSVLGGW